MLEALGARLDLSPMESREILDQTGFCFLLAPDYHPGIAHAGAVRRALKVRTIMNLLGPCLNPARPKVQLLGVADPKLLRPIGETLRALGVERALVVHGSGLDEVALHGFTQAIRLRRRRNSKSSRSRPSKPALIGAPFDQDCRRRAPTRMPRRLARSARPVLVDAADIAVVASMPAHCC